MPSFPKPRFNYEYDPQAQINALRDYEATKPGRDIPDKAADRLLIATWNIANLGREDQDRRPKDFMLIAELISWFDLVAVQEVNDDLTGLRGVQQFLPTSYRVLFSDRGGNEERIAFVYDSDRVRYWRRLARSPMPPRTRRT